MSSFVGEKDRKIVPRWRTFTSSIEVLSNGKDELTLQIPSPSLQSNIDDWEREGSLWTALDLVAGAIVESRLDLASTALEHIRANPLTPRVALALLHENDANLAPDEEAHLPIEERCKAQIHSARYRLANYPFDAIEWTELARSFTTLGLREKAQRCISAAITLAPSDVFVLRSASRFHIQQLDPDKAQWILTRCARTRSNPWLLASEIAAASMTGRNSSLIRVARQMEQGDFRNEDLTELRAALATNEIDSGSENRGKKLLRRSLKGANENSLAQIQWVDRTRLGNIIDISGVKPPHRYEAGAWRSYFEGNWAKAASCAKQWFEDQPFSLNAGIFCSFALTDLAKMPGQALGVLEIALRANTENHTLKNNLAFTHIQLGDLALAEKILGTISTVPEDSDDAMVEATLGLLRFRQGLTQEGRLLYLSSIQTLQKKGLGEYASRAALFLALEEVALRTEEAPASVRRALDLAKGQERSDVVMKVDELKAAMEAWFNEANESRDDGPQRQQSPP